MATKLQHFPQWQQPTPAPKADKPKRRVFPWILLAVQLLFILWLITGIFGAAGTHCDPTLTHADCTAAKQVGGTIGVALIVFLWLAVDVILIGCWAVFRWTRKPRP